MRSWELCVFRYVVFCAEFALFIPHAIYTLSSCLDLCRASLSRSGARLSLHNTQNLAFYFDYWVDLTLAKANRLQTITELPATTLYGNDNNTRLL